MGIVAPLPDPDPDSGVLVAQDPLLRAPGEGWVEYEVALPCGHLTSVFRKAPTTLRPVVLGAEPVGVDGFVRLDTRQGCHSPRHEIDGQVLQRRRIVARPVVDRPPDLLCGL